MVPHTASSVYRTIKAPIQSHKVAVAKHIVSKPDASTQGREHQVFRGGSMMSNLEREPKLPREPEVRTTGIARDGGLSYASRASIGL